MAIVEPFTATSTRAVPAMTGGTTGTCGTRRTHRRDRSGLQLRGCSESRGRSRSHQDVSVLPVLIKPRELARGSHGPVHPAAAAVGRPVERGIAGAEMH